MGKIYTFNNKIVTLNNKWCEEYVEPTPPVDPYNPLGLPAYTIRLKFKDGSTPAFTNGTATQVSSSPNIWDLTYQSDNWFNMFEWPATANLLEVMGANTSNISRFEGIFSGCSSLTSVSLFDTSSMTNVSSLFNSCSSLTSVPLYDTSNVTNMYSMFQQCTSLQTIPLFNTSKVTNAGYMFYYCTNVQSGALALYNQMSSQTNPPSNHTSTFTSCGDGNPSGAAELAQIPSGWK